MSVRFAVLMLLVPVDNIAHDVYIRLAVLQGDLERRANFDVTRGGEDTWVKGLENRGVGACSAVRNLNVQDLATSRNTSASRVTPLAVAALVSFSAGG
jgi:hypothetical protein